MQAYEKIVAINDEWAQIGMERQVLEPGSRFYGGIRDPLTGVAWPSHVSGAPTYIATWATALLCKDSRYYRDEQLAERLALAASFQLRSQHRDGTISPGFTNMHSPPDTAFVISGLAQIYELLTASDWEPLEAAAGTIRQFLERTVPAMLTGGCHTPNHRWVLTAALGFLYRLTGDMALRQRAGEWLAEGMDCTADGEWTERSNGIYNSVSDLSLYYTAEQFDMPELLDPVRRNLQMMTYMIHPDGEVVTDYSGRQDFGTAAQASTYFLIASLMSREGATPEIAALAAHAGKALTLPGGLPNHTLTGVLRYPDLLQIQAASAPLPERYRIVFNADVPRARYLQDMKHAGHAGVIYHSRMHTEFGAAVARHREGRTSATVMTESQSFFSLRHGSARLLGVQVATAFEPGFVKLQQLEVAEQGYRLSARETKGYYGPLGGDLLPETATTPCSPWYLLPHHLREITHEQEHRLQVDLTEDGEGWLIRIRCDEPELLMTQVSFLLSSEGELAGEHLVEQAPNRFMLTQGSVKLSAGDDWIAIDGGSQDHLAPSLRTVYPEQCRTVLVNLLTPYDHTFRITLSPADPVLPATSPVQAD
ncbi:hypothetical protein [Paenibacillus daejeonensis]|uniref:hypothetical protein n=1 Tax=Paenibacillus daejeonensis TaxID=135193 RepID=UPI000374776B|nr:hypothetical protein [Paenibacillus daejeonensis]